MNLLHWFNSPIAAAQDEALWPWVTVGLCGLVLLGYGVIAFNWYFQAKLASPQSRRSAIRLSGIVLCAVALGALFYLADPSWRAWRVYDGALLLLACYTWMCTWSMRGLSLVDDRLAQVQELEKSAVKYREIAELLPQVVWTANAHGLIDFSNKRWTDYAGDSTTTWLDAVHPEEREQVEQWWQIALAARSPIGREIRLKGAAGYRTFLVRATPVVQGEAVKWLGACADIDDQKRYAAEKEMQARQKTFFLNALSHDLRAPLHNVVLNAHLLRMSAKDRADLDSINVILENAAAAGDLVTRLLEYARAGEERSLAERVSMAAMVQQLVRRYQQAATRKGLVIRTSGFERDAEILVDRHKVERVLGNLLDNAIKFTEKGGVKLELVAGPASTSVAAGRATPLSVRISDTGIGIPEASVPFLFDEFYQVSNHERDRSKGFGIGLAICRSLARQVGGDVRLLHTGPGGSCFEVVLLGGDLDGIVVGSAAGVGAGGGGRPNGSPRDRAHSEGLGVCSV